LLVAAARRHVTCQGWAAGEAPVAGCIGSQPSKHAGRAPVIDLDQPLSSPGGSRSSMR
jgi:hypothetical protein